jgi:MATE family multidrug resistance protein
MIFLLLHPEPLLALSQLQPEVEIRVRGYLDALAWSVVPALMFRIFYGFTSGIGKTRPIMMFNLVGLVLKLPLNMWFMYGGLGVEAMGGPGCAVATAIINWLTCLMAWAWCARAEECRDYQLFTGWSAPRWKDIASLLKLGLPIGATFFVDVTAFTFMALFIARLGAATSAAHQIASNLAALAFMLPLSLGNAASVLAGQALGAGDARQARHAGVATIAIGLTCGVLAGLLLWFGAGFFASLYTADAEVRQLATLLIGYVAVYHVFDALQAVVMSVLRGYKKTTAPMLIYAVALWGVGLGGGYTLGLTDWVAAPAGAPGFWLAAILSLMLGGGLVGVYFDRVSKLARDHDLR